MDQHPPPTTTAATASTTTPTATEPPPQQQEQPSTPSTSTPTPTPTPSPTPITNPNPSTVSKPSQPLRPPSSFSRPWQQQQQQQQHFPHFSSSTTSSPAVTAPRGGIALGVPAASTQPGSSFSGSFAQHQQFGGLRAGPNVPDSVSSSSPLQAKPQVQGMGMMGSQMQRPGGISVQHHQQRPLQQSSLRPTLSSASSQSPATPNFQGQALMRVSSVGPPSSPSTPQSMHNQPWLSSGQQGKPPLPPTTSYRPQMNSPSMQQRSHIPQPHVAMPAASQQHVSSAQPTPRPSHQLPDQYGQQQFTPPRSITHQLQMARTSSTANPRPPSLATVPSVPSTPAQSLTQSKPARTENDEYCNRILGKRSINELVNQIDPSEKLDSEVEEILVDIAEDFVDSITTFGCSLAKHRKSDVLEAKDILLHLERNWNLTLPGFGGDEIKTYRKPVTNDIHKERLAVIKKSVMATESANTKTSAGQGGASAKANLGKVPSNAIGSS